MKTIRFVSRALTLSALLFVANCSTSNSEAVDEIVDDSSDNQVATPPSDDEDTDSTIPSPEQVTQESPVVPAGDTGSVDANTPPTVQELANDQQAASPLSTTEDHSQSGMSGQEPQQLAAQDVQAPTLSEIAVINQESEEETTDSLSPPKVAKVHRKAKAHSKVKRSSKSSSNNRSAVADGSHGIYVVQPGDTLGTIARVIYGSHRRWQDIANANQLSSSSPIYPGDTLKYPADANAGNFDSEWQNLPQATLIVKKSDTLSGLAERLMGSPHYWKLLWRWNEAAIANPHQISPGQSLQYVKKEDLTAFVTERKNRVPAH